MTDPKITLFKVEDYYREMAELSEALKGANTAIVDAMGEVGAALSLLATEGYCTSCQQPLVQEIGDKGYTYHPDGVPAICPVADGEGFVPHYYFIEKSVVDSDD